ncbi:Isochorismatase-like protein [Xylariales sp. AK1849]|nr:Isochorismatase-like protein [Xylariales sp. AK1849]
MSAKSFRELIGVSPSRASPADSTLLIIDAQNEYAEGLLRTSNVDSTRRAISSLLEIYRNVGKGENIVHITHQTPPGAPVFTSDTRLAAEFDELSPKQGEKTVVKQYPGSFTGTDLGEHLEKLGAKKVVLAGYMAHVCVSTTARQAAEKGLDVVVVKEAIGDRDVPGLKAEQLVEATLAELGDAFGSIVSIQDVK